MSVLEEKEIIKKIADYTLYMSNLNRGLDTNNADLFRPRSTLISTTENEGMKMTAFEMTRSSDRCRR